MGLNCVKNRVTVDLFYAMNNYKSLDLAQITPLTSLTGGECYLYSPFDINKQGEKIHYDIFRIISRAD